jgi:hypothetical protein
VISGLVVAVCLGSCTNGSLPQSVQELEGRREEAVITTVVMGLIDRHGGNRVPCMGNLDYDPPTEKLLRYVRERVPTVRPAADCTRRSAGAVVTSTGDPAIVIGVGHVVWRDQRRADVEATYFVGGKAAGRLTAHLTFAFGRWGIDGETPLARS